MLAEGGGKKLAAVVALHASDCGVVLRSDKREKSQECVTCVGFCVERKNARVVRVVIEYHKIIFVTRTTNNGRSPQITMY
jgi:hypothetical protein